MIKQKSISFRWWQLLGIPIIGINVWRWIWMLQDGWYEGLWLSQWIGLFEGIVILTGARNRFVNGVYLYMGFLPMLAFFIKLFDPTDIYFYLNHFPNIAIFLYFRKLQNVDLRGVRVGLIIFLIALNMTFYLGYFLDFSSVYINTTTHPLFPLVLAIIVIWYIFLEYYIPRRLQHPSAK